MAPSLVPPLRDALATRDPVRVASATLLLSEMCFQCRAFSRALLPHFWMFGQVLNLFMQQKMTVDMGYNSRGIFKLESLIHHLLWQLDQAGGQQARRTITRYCPLYSPPVPVSASRKVHRLRQHGV